MVLQLSVAARCSVPARVGCREDVGVAVLRTLVYRAINEARFVSRGVCLELFAGTGRLTQKMKSLGLAAVAVDILDHPSLNITRPCIRRFIIALVKHGIVTRVWLGTQCTTWCQACRPMIRSSHHIWGCPDITADQQFRINKGNAHARASSSIIRACISC